MALQRGLPGNAAYDHDVALPGGIVCAVAGNATPGECAQAKLGRLPARFRVAEACRGRYCDVVHLMLRHPAA